MKTHLGFEVLSIPTLRNETSASSDPSRSVSAGEAVPAFTVWPAAPTQTSSGTVGKPACKECLWPPGRSPDAERKLTELPLPGKGQVFLAPPSAWLGSAGCPPRASEGTGSWLS